MTRVNPKARLHKLLDNELSSSSNDKNQVISGYKSLIDILQIPQLGKQLHGYHEVIFECISQIILTPSNQFFDDNQLQQLLESASNACVLSMSQNQIIDGWLQNIEERTFEKPDDDEDEDDDDLYEDATESEEEEVLPKRDNTSRSTRTGGNQRAPKVSFQLDSKAPSANEKSLPLTQAKPNQRNAHVAHARNHRGGHQNSERSDVSATSTHVNDNRRGRGRGRGRGSSNTNNAHKDSDGGRGKGRRAPAFDNKYGVDLRLYDCYICGEYGHVQYDCPKKQDGSKRVSRGGGRGGFKNKRSRNRPKSSSSSSSIETTPNDSDQNHLQQVYNQSSKLLNSSQKLDERNETFELFLSLIEKAQRRHGENLAKIFLEKESTFYSLFCHIAQNDFLFTADQYSKLYHLKNVLLPQKQCLLNEDRSIFSRQRNLIPLEIITEHIRNTTQIQQTIFNDFQEYIIRSIPPISIVLYDLIKFILKSNIHIDILCFENWTKKILFDMKKNIFSNEQFDELQSYLYIRTKRSERNNQKQIWKERLILFKNDRFVEDLNQWIGEFEQILRTNDNEQEELSRMVNHHAMWYFAVLLMASSGHLNREQYERLLNAAIQSTMFSSRQKFYFQVYLKQGQAPITMKELNDVRIQLESDDTREKESAYEKVRVILERPKPGVDNEEIDQSSPQVNDFTQVTDQSKHMEDTIPIIDNHVLSRLISLVETICTDTDTFSTTQCAELLDQFLYHSSIVRPLPQPDQNRLRTYYSRPVSLNELKRNCSSISSDLNDLLSLLQNRTLSNNEIVFDFLTETIVKIFQNRRKYSNEKCAELKSLMKKRIFGKKHNQLINESFQKFRMNKEDLPPINPTILNQLLTNILSHDYQAHLEFFTLLEDVCCSIDWNEITIEFEINRCLLSTIVLVIIEADFSNTGNTDFSNATNADFFRDRLKMIIDKQRDFFQLLLTEQQYQLVTSRRTSASDINGLIELVKTNLNEKNWMNLMDFIQNGLSEKNDFGELIKFVLHTFDYELLSIEQALQVTNLLFEHPKLNNKSWKNLLQFLLDLLQLNIRSSPKVFLHFIENNQDDSQTIDQILMILNAKNGKYAVADWKRTMMQLLTILFDRKGNHEELRNIAQQSPMLQMAVVEHEELECNSKKTSDNQANGNKEPSAIPKTTDSIDHSAAHREIFHHLECDDPSKNALIVEQFRAYLLDEQLSSDILPSKFLQALQIIFRNPQKFTQVSLDEWSTLIEKNRGKIFSNDAQCDELLMTILFIRLNMPNDTIKSLQRLIQSKKAQERHAGVEKLLLLLNNTQMNNTKSKTIHLPTISAPLYDTITRVVFDQKFNDVQVRKCLTAAKNSWLLNSDHRQKLNV